MLKLVRWLLVIPAAIVGWVIAFATAVFLYEGIAGLCPENVQYEEDLFLCVPRALDWAISAGAALAAILVVLLAVICAPSHKRFVAWLTYMAGAAVALLLFMEMGSDARMPFISALSSGLLTAILIHRRASRRSIFRDRNELRFRSR